MSCRGGAGGQHTFVVAVAVVLGTHFWGVLRDRAKSSSTEVAKETHLDGSFAAFSNQRHEWMCGTF